MDHAPPPFHVLVNPHAGCLRNGHVHRRDLVDALGGETQLTFTRDLDHLDEVVRSLRASGVQHVALLGGDGTILEVCSRFSRDGGVLPDVFLLGGGTTNALCQELGLTGGPLERLARLRTLVEGRAAATRVERNLLRVNDVLGFTFGAGYLPRISAYYDSHRVDGLWTALAVSLEVSLGMLLGVRRSVALLDEVPADVTLDDDTLGLDAFNFAYLSTLQGNGLGLSVTPAATDSADRFEAVIARTTPREFVAAFARACFGTPFTTRQQARRLVRSVRFDFATPSPWFMDGERFPAVQTLAVSLGPRLGLLV